MCNFFKGVFEKSIVFLNDFFDKPTTFSKEFLRKAATFSREFLRVRRSGGFEVTGLREAALLQRRARAGRFA